MTSKPMFGTDNGPACRCGGTIYGYDVVGEDVVTVTATCYGCRHVTYFVTDACDSAAGLSMAHRVAALFYPGKR